MASALCVRLKRIGVGIGSGIAQHRERERTIGEKGN